MRIKIYESNGVKYFVDESAYRSACLVDIEVERGVKTVNLGPKLNGKTLSINLRQVMKQFPDVEHLNISSNVSLMMNISNFMFPNVRKVTSESKHFASGEMLCIQTYNQKLHLLNAFCRPERDVIDLRRVTTICAYALEGTYARKFINAEGVHLNHQHNVLSGHISQINPSIFMHNGLFTIGNNLCMFDKTMNRIIIPENICGCLSEVDFSTIDEVVVNSTTQLQFIGKSINSKTLLVDSNDRIDFNQIDSIKVPISECITISKKNPFYSSDNGVIYNHDNRILVGCLNQFVKKPIEIPDSVCEIGHSAFNHCIFLEPVKIGDGVVEIGEKAFSHCNLKNICIPKNVELIRKNAFEKNQLECVTLNDGLQEIMEGAFRYNPIQEIHIPKSVRRMGVNSLPRHIKDVYVDTQYPADIVSSMMDEDLSNDSGSYCIHIKNYGNVYIPKSMAKTSIDFLNSEFNLRQLDKQFTNSLYDYGTDTVGKQNTAMLVYKDTKDEAVGKYLRRAGRSIAKRLIKERDDDMLIQFVKTGLLTGKTLRAVMDMANNANMSISAAYILKELESSDENNSFRL